ncbi:MAG: hypothetical protein Q4Q17_02525 [Tissierellia bacterium]|nr:hypothetical protein [Tissierellia bacterium]
MRKTIAIVLALAMLLLPTTIFAEKSAAQIDQEVNAAMRKLMQPMSPLMAMFREDAQIYGRDWGAPDDGAGTRFETVVVTLRGNLYDVAPTYFFNSGGYKGTLRYQHKEFVVINGENYTLVKYNGEVTKH